MKLKGEMLTDPRVAVSRLPEANYTEASEVAKALDRAAGELGWSSGERGPFGSLIPKGARVLIKPNLVHHENQGGGGMESLVTHRSLICAVVEGALGADPGEVVVGDAPLQSCDWGRLLAAAGLDAWAEALAGRDPRFKGIRDLRRTASIFINGVRVAEELRQSRDRFFLFDLGRVSLLEPITDDRRSFRVTCYDPRLMAMTHARGRHQYLIARDVIDADVIINLPKLKTHKKAGITGALKNLVGINGNKEYLPHHRVGGAQSGGDCYPGRSPVKRALEYVADQQNMASSLTAGKVLGGVAAQIERALRLMGDRLGVEGSWAGNDTVWRMGLDLNRILLYGRPDGTLSEEPQRQVLHVVDAVVAGQGDGPLSPQPLLLGLILAGRNAAAVDLVGAHLLGYDPMRVSIVREAFGRFSHPITSFTSREALLLGDLGEGAADEMFRRRGPLRPVIHPDGWRPAAATIRQLI